MRATVKLIFQRIENSQECRQTVCYFVKNIDILFATFVMKTNHLTWFTTAVRAVGFLERRIISLEEKVKFSSERRISDVYTIYDDVWNEKKLCLLRDDNTLDIIANILSIDKKYSRDMQSTEYDWIYKNGKNNPTKEFSVFTLPVTRHLYQMRSSV